MNIPKTIAICISAFSFCGFNTQAKEIARSDYKLTVPDTCTVNPASADIDLDHMTTINFPGNNSMTITVLDDKSGTDEAFKDMVDAFKAKMKNVKEIPGTFLDARGGKYTALQGVLNGANLINEVRSLKGKTKGLMMITISFQSEKPERIEMQKAAETLRMNAEARPTREAIDSAEALLDSITKEIQRSARAAEIQAMMPWIAYCTGFIIGRNRVPKDETGDTLIVVLAENLKARGAPNIECIEKLADYYKKSYPEIYGQYLKKSLKNK